MDSIDINQQITITVLKNRIRVKTPYNEVFSRRMKLIPGHNFDYKFSKAWTIPLEQEQAVRNLIKEVYHVELNEADQASSPLTSISQPPETVIMAKTVLAVDNDDDIWDQIFERKNEVLNHLGINTTNAVEKRQRGCSITSIDGQQYTLLSDPVLRLCDGQYEYYALAAKDLDSDKYVLFWPIGNEYPANPLNEVNWGQFSYRIIQGEKNNDCE